MVERLKIRVEGSGVAATIAAVLLAQRGYAVSFDRQRKLSRRIIAIPKDSVDLISDLVGVSIDRIVNARWVAERRVAWNSAEFTRVPFAALVCEVGELAAALAEHCPHRMIPYECPGLAPADRDWLVIAGGRPSAFRLQGGRRVAVSGWVEDLEGFQRDTTLVACVPNGWLFAAADPANGIALVLISPFRAVGAMQHEALYAAVDYLWPGCVSGVLAVGENAVPAAPSLDPACAARGRISVGNAALALDPLRGDGVGFAARGALLAQSVVAAISEGRDCGACVGHYAGRLAYVFKAHVRNCAFHYASAWNAGIWRAEMEQMSRCLGGQAPDPASDFRLRGRDLIAT
jgi:hypothetical protein